MNSVSGFSTFSHTDLLRIQHRIIAVWALAEGVLGGVLHALRIPLTGLVIGGIAVFCLVLLSQFRQSRGDLLKATILVLLLKAMLSPHTPAAAYFAVLSQGLLAELFFFSKRNFRLSCIFFGFFTQVQSALLHIGKLVLVFGMDIWLAIDEYIGKIAQSIGLESGPFTVYLAGIYIAIHALAGIFIGSIAAGLKNRSADSFASENPFVTKHPGMEIKPKQKKQKFRLQAGMVIIWLILLAAILQSYFGLGPEILPKHKIFHILLRSIFIVTAWYYVVSPLLMRLLKKWLSGKKNKFQTELETVLQLLPETGALLQSCWIQSARSSGLNRIPTFLSLALKQLFILPSEKH